MAQREKNLNAGDLGLILGKIPPGEGNGNPLHYSYLEHFTDRGVWWASLWSHKESDTIEHEHD